MTIAAVLARRAREHPDALAFAMRGETLTYRQLLDDADSLASLLTHDGIVAGDRVAIVMPAGLDLVRVFFALQRIGAAPCIFDPHVPEQTTARRVAAIRPIAILRGAMDVTAGDRRQTAGTRETLLPSAACRLPPAFLQLTSGTSGEPLVACVLQRNAIASLDASRDLFDPRPSDVLVGWVPPWHDLGLLRFVLAPVYWGVPCHLIPPAVKTIPEWFATIAKERGTITGAPDFAWRLATRLVDPSSVDLRSLRFATNGGEPVRESTLAAFESAFGLHGVLRPGYGLAEATLGVTSTRTGETVRVDKRGNVSCGKAMRDIEVRIDRHEIIVRGPNAFVGYFDADEETARVLRDGWLHTGDHGALDDDGNLYVLGRQRAMIKRGGAMLAPRELEEAAQSVPGVRLAAAVGVPSDVSEEIVVVIEVERGAQAIETLVRSAVEKAIGVAPDRVLVQEARTIPRTSNGKIRHALLRDQLTPSRLRSNPSVSSEGESER